MTVDTVTVLWLELGCVRCVRVGCVALGLDGAYW
jgi:hypothetical protein